MRRAAAKFLNLRASWRSGFRNKRKERQSGEAIFAEERRMVSFVSIGRVFELDEGGKVAPLAAGQSTRRVETQ
jgi:hypothetical protein